MLLLLLLAKGGDTTTFSTRAAVLLLLPLNGWLAETGDDDGSARAQEPREQTRLFVVLA